MGTYDYDIVVVGGGPAGAAAAKAAVGGGLKTLLLERQEMPRHKPCSGMILPAATRYIEKYFGVLPEDVMAEPASWKGSRFHLRGGQVFLLASPNTNVWRNKLDSWLCSESGAETWDSTSLLDFAEWRDHVELVCRRGEEEIRLSAPVVVAADGGVSRMVNKIEPAFGRGVPSHVYSHQDYRRGTVELDPDYYHIFMEPGIGLMPTLYFKDDLMVTDTIVFAGQKVDPVREKYTRWLADNHGFKPDEPDMTLGCQAWGAQTINRFCLGTDRVLVAGEAAGFLNAFMEGISSAIATGYLAGQAAVECSDRPPGPAYRESVKPERERTVGEWYPPWLMTGKAAPYFRDCLMAAPPVVRLKAMTEIVAWLKRLGYSNRTAIELVLRKLLNGSFDFRA